MTELVTNSTELELGELSDIDALDSLLTVAGSQVIDVGCGDGRFARLLAERGARVLGVEPGRKEPESITVTGNGSLRIQPGRAQALPLAEACADVVVFKYSLHHVPAEDMVVALTEAIRVLKPRGSLYVAEPLPEGPSHEITRSFHDESEVQAAARDALHTTAMPRFQEQRVCRYTTHYRYRDFAEFVEEMTSKDYNHYSRADVDNDTVRLAFEACANPTGYVLRHPVRINLFTHPRSALQTSP